MGDCLITGLSGGSWVFRGDVWVYEGSQVSHGWLTLVSITFPDLVKMIRIKLGMEEENRVLRLRYCSVALAGIPPIYVVCDDDLEGFMFSNSFGKVFQTPLYCEVEIADGEVKPSVIPKTEEMEVLSSAPDMQTQTQTPTGYTQLNDRKRKSGNTNIPTEVVCLSTNEDDEKSDRDVVDLTGYVDLTDCEDIDADARDEGKNEHPRREGKDHGSSSSDSKSEDSYLWWDKFTTMCMAAPNVNCIGEGPSRSYIELSDEDDDDDEYNLDFFKELDQAELRALKSHHPFVEANVDDYDHDGARSGSAVRLGALFEDKASLKNAIVEYAVEHCFETSVRRSKPGRLVVGCKVKSCRFLISAAVITNTTSFKVKRFVTEHSCGLKYSHTPGKKATVEYVANKIVERYNLSKKMMSASSIRKGLKLLGIDISYIKACRARRVAEDMIRGTAEESFMYMHSWLEMLKMLNPGSYTAIKTDSNNRFEACFWALGCTIASIPHLRKVISVDGAHLSGRYPRVLLMGVAQDPNNHIYPIAFTIVGSESKVSWSFFFELMKLSGAVPDSVETIVVSDRHKSIRAALKLHYKLAGHGFCAYHLYHNLRPKGCGPSLVQDQWFNVAKAYTLEDFQREMAMLKKIAQRMAQKAMEVPVESWSRAHCHYERFNIMTTNNSESLNAVVKDERAWPIILLFNALLQTMSSWFNDRRSQPERVDDEPATKVLCTLENRRLQSLSLRATRLSQHVAEVREGFKTFEVDLRQRKCQCEQHFDVNSACEQHF